MSIPTMMNAGAATDAPPGGVTDLSIQAGPDDATLGFTVPFENGDSGGVPAYYEVRALVGADIVGELQWSEAAILDGPWTSVATAHATWTAGQPGDLYISGLYFATDTYIAIRFKDAGGNVGPISNRVVFTP